MCIVYYAVLYVWKHTDVMIIFDIYMYIYMLIYDNKICLYKYTNIKRLVYVWYRMVKGGQNYEGGCIYINTIVKYCLYVNKCTYVYVCVLLVCSGW